MDFKYQDNMKKLIESYNSIYNSDSNKKNQILFYLLYIMYQKQFNKQINVGVLSQIITKPLGRQLSFLLDAGSNEKITFDEEKNILRLGDVFQVTISQCPGFMQEEGDFGDSINVIFINKHERCSEHFILCSNENELWLEHNMSLTKGVAFDSIHEKPYSIKSYEKRTFDVSGIEIERQINSNIELGISNVPSFSYGSTKMTEFGVIKNKIKVFRDPIYFKMARIEMIQKDIIYGTFQVTTKEQSSVKERTPIMLTKEAYGLCPYGQSLDVNDYKDTYEEAIEQCGSLNYLNINDVATEYRGPETDPRLDFIPKMNEQIRNRIEKAKTYYNSYAGKHKNNI